MIVLGIALLVTGFLAKIAIVRTIGGTALVAGIPLAPRLDRPSGGRRAPLPGTMLRMAAGTRVGLETRSIPIEKPPAPGPRVLRDLRGPLGRNG